MYKFCSYCVLGRHTGTATFKAYGVSEDCGYVVFQYNTIENEAALVRLKRPVIEPDRSGYNLDQCTTTAFRMLEFYPCIIYLSQESYRNIIFMCPRVCTDIDGVVVEESSS